MNESNRKWTTALLKMKKSEGTFTEEDRIRGRRHCGAAFRKGFCVICLAGNTRSSFSVGRTDFVLSVGRHPRDDLTSSPRRHMGDMLSGAARITPEDDDI